MTVTTSLPLACVFQCLFTLILHSFLLRLDWWKCDSSVDGEPQGNWRWNSNSRDVFASSPSFSRPALPRPGELAHRLPPQKGNRLRRAQTLLPPPPPPPPPPLPNPRFLKFSKWNVWFRHVNGKHCWQLENLVKTIGFGPQI